MCGQTLMANAIEDEARRTVGKKQLAMEAFARALRQLPTIIADNAGLDSADIVRGVQAASGVWSVLCTHSRLPLCLWVYACARNTGDSVVVVSGGLCVWSWWCCRSRTCVRHTMLATSARASTSARAPWVT